MALQFRRAEKTKARLRLALIGPAGSGKSYSALVLAKALAEGGRVAVLDTERGSASLYADLFEFDVLELDSFEPQTYVEAIHTAENEGYRVIVIDSLSHAWEGKGGALDQKDMAEKRQRTPNSYTAWREVTPLHNALVDAMLQSSAHVIATMRSKTEYVQEKDANGRTVVRKVGMKPIQRDGMDFEFTVAGDLDWDHNLIITKSRIPALADQVINRPGPQLGETILRWLNSGIEPTERPVAATTEAPPTQASASPEKTASSHRQPTAATAPLSQHEALTQMTDFEPKEFVARAAALGYVLPDGGGNDYIRIVAALGLRPAAGQKAAGAQLADWRKRPGNTYRKALATLADAADQQGRQAAVPTKVATDEDAPPFDACPRCKGEQWQGGVCQQCGYGVGDEEPACRECGAVGGIKDGSCTFCGTDQLPVNAQSVDVPSVAVAEASSDRQEALAGMPAKAGA